MLNIYFVCSVRGKDSRSVAWAGWALPPRLVTLGWSICFPKPLLPASAKAISLQGLVKSRLRQAMALNNSLVLKRSKIPDITRFLASSALHTHACKNHLSAQLQRKTPPVSQAARCFTAAIKRQYKVPYSNKKYSTCSATARRESPPSLFCLLTWKITSKHEITGGGKKPYTPEHVCF